MYHILATHGDVLVRGRMEDW